MILFFYRAAEYLVRTGPIVTLEVAKQGAIYHGLATLLSQPSPVMNRGMYLLFIIEYLNFFYFILQIDSIMLFHCLIIHFALMTK